MKCLAALLLCSAAAQAATGPPDEVGALVRQGYDEFYNLDYAEAIPHFEKAVALDPGLPDLHNHVAQALLYSELLRDGALDSQLVTGNNSFVRRARMEPPPGLEQRFDAQVDESIRLCRERLAHNPRDIDALHTIAVAYGLKANWGFLVRKTWVASLGDATKAHKYDIEVTQLDPSDYDAKLIQGLYDYVIGSLPWSMRMIGFVAGYRGDKARGLATIEDVARKGRENRTDAKIVLCALYRREGEARRAIPLVLEFIGQYPRNYLLRFELAQMYAASGKRREALAALADIAKLKRENAPGYARVPAPKIAYETGNLEFWFDDLGAALQYLQQATATPEDLKQLDLNTAVIALMRQGQIYDLRHRHDLAIPLYRRAAALAPDSDAAKESVRYIGRPYKRPAQG